MKEIIAKIFFVFLLICTACCMKNKRSESKPQVAVSIPPYLYFVQRIGGDLVESFSLVPEQVNPHVYDPTPKQVNLLYQAKVWIKLSELFEKKIFKILQEEKKGILIVNLAESVPLLSAEKDNICSHGSQEHIHSEGKDLHIWLSPKLAQIQASIIAEALIQAFPENKAFFEKNLQEFLQDLKDLDEEITEKLKPFKGNAILTSHPAFGYFCKDYNLLQLSVECEGKEPRPQDLDKLLDLINKQKILAVLAETQYNNKGAEMIAQKLNLPLYLVDPYSSNYLENLKHLTNEIAYPK